MSGNKWLLAVGTLAGSIIGAGIFALPFLFATFGTVWSFVLLGVGTLAYALIHLLYADVLFQTPGVHLFVGLARRYLGRTARAAAVCMIVVEMILVLTVYIILAVSFVRILSPSLAPLIAAFLFWLLGTILIAVKLQGIALFEEYAVFGILAIIGVVFLLGARPAALAFFPAFPGDAAGILAPLAPLFFALAGRVAIPPVLSLLRSAPRKRIRSAILAGTVVPAAVYALFVYGVIGASREVTPDAVTGLIATFPSWALILIGLLGLAALITSYIVVGLDVRETLRSDLRIPRTLAALIVVVFPFLFYLAGIGSFLMLIAFIGGIFLSLESLFIIGMWMKLPHHRGRAASLFEHAPSRWVLFSLVLLFGITLLYQVFA